MKSEIQKFSERLNATLDEAGIPKAGQGRQSTLASILDVTPHTIGQWLKGDGYPQTAKLIKLSEHLHVRSNWLFSGLGEKYLPGYEASGKGVGFQLSRDAAELVRAWMSLNESQRQATRLIIMDLAKTTADNS